jgi:large subunit ribosomal protein L9
MKVILCEDMDNLGAMGETVKVADGYARNFLIPRRLAVGAESASAKQIAHELAIIRRKEEKRRAEMASKAEKIEGVTVEIEMRAGEEEKLFGSVTSTMIAEKLEEQGHSVERRKIRLDEPIKALGIFTVPVKLAEGIEAQIKVWVKKLEDEESELTPGETE